MQARGYTENKSDIRGYRDFMSTVYHAPSKDDTTHLLKDTFEDPEKCKTILDDPAFNLEGFKHLIQTKTLLPNHISLMFDFAHRVKSIIQQHQPQLLVDIGEQVAAKLDNNDIKNHSLSFTTFALCQLFINERLDELKPALDPDGSENHHQLEYDLLTKLGEMLKIAMTMVSDINPQNDHKERNDEKEKESRKKAENDVNAVMARLNLSSDRQDEDFQYAIWLSLQDATPNKQNDIKPTVEKSPENEASNTQRNTLSPKFFNRKPEGLCDPHDLYCDSDDDYTDSDDEKEKLSPSPQRRK